MTKNIAEVMTKIVEELAPLTSEERQRVIQASFALLGEGGQPTISSASNENTHGESGHNPKAQNWLKQNKLSLEELEQVFHLAGENTEIIAAEIPGKNQRDKTRNAYVLFGLSKLISSGDPLFDDKSARSFCEKSGCYDSTNHSKYLKGGNEFTGSKEKGWTLTAPGLKYGAALIVELNKQS